MQELILYRKDGACSVAAHILLLELNLPFIDVPMVEGANRLYEGAPGTGLDRAAWVEINPTGYVPALSVDGQIVTELSAVLFFISSLAPERGMTGRKPWEVAQTLEWLSYLSTTLNEYGFAGYWRPRRMLGMDASREAEDAVRSEGKKTVLKGFDWVEKKLEGKRFAVGDQVTVVEFVLHTMWRWGAAGGFKMDVYPRFRQIVREVETLNSVRTALEAENVPLQFL